MAAILNPEDELCQHLYALCLQWVNQDYELSEEYYIRAMEITKGAVTSGISCAGQSIKMNEHRWVLHRLDNLKIAHVQKVVL